MDRELFLVHTGAVGIFRHIPDYKGLGEFGKPIAVYRHGWFLNRDFLLRSQTKYYAVALEDGEIVYWTKHEWQRMRREQPFMANSILEAAMRQASCDMERVTTMLNSCGSNITENTEDMKDSAKDKSKRKDAMWETVMGEENQLPEDLETRLEGMMNAQSLEKFRLYEPIPDNEKGYLPDMPAPIRRDLECAFKTFKHISMEGKEVLPWKEVNKALMYAGVFGCLLVPETHANAHDLTCEEFCEVGHEAIFHRFSNMQLVKIYNCFKKCVSKTGGEIPRDDLHECLKTSFLPGIAEQEVNGIAEIWDSDASDSVNASEWLGVVSRIVRRHEIDWNLMRGCRDLCRKSSKSRIGPMDIVNVKKLMLKNDGTGDQWHHELTETDCTEMLWCNACYSRLLSANQQGEILDFSGLVGAVCFQVPKPKGRLPPPPDKEFSHALTSFERFKSVVNHADAGHNSMLEQFKHKISVTEGHANSHNESDGGDVPGPLQSDGLVTGSGSKPPEKSEVGTPANGSDSPPSSEKDNNVAPMPFIDDVPEFDFMEAKSMIDDDDELSAPASEAPGRGKFKMKKKKVMKKKTGKDKDGDFSEMQPLLEEVEDERAGLVVQEKRDEPAAPVMLPGVNPRASESALRREGFAKKKSMVSFVDEGAIKPGEYDPKAPKNLEALASAKEKVANRLKEICRKLQMVGADVALKECDIHENDKEARKMVGDLRNTPSATANPKMFLKTKLDKCNFDEEHRKSDERLHNDFLLKEWTVPDTPDVKIHLLLDFPQSSRLATIWSLVMGVVIMLSVGMMFMKGIIYPTGEPMNLEEQTYWRVGEASFTLIFLSELTVRFAVADALGTQTRVEFCLKPLNICDFLACAPFVMEMAAGRAASSENLSFLRVARLLRLTRVLRIARLGGRDKAAILGPVAVIFTIIWGIYIKEEQGLV